MKVSELFAEIGFKVDTSGLSGFTKEMSQLQKIIKSSVSGLKEFANVAQQVSKAIRDIRLANAISDKEFASRYRAETYLIRSQGKRLRGLGDYDGGRGAYWFERSKTVEAAEGRLQRSLALREKMYEDRKSGAGFGSLFKKAIGGNANSFIAAVLAFKGAVDSFGFITKRIGESVERAFNFRNVQYASDLNPDYIKRVQFQIGRGGTGLSSRQVAEDLAAFNQQLVALRYGRGNYEPFAMLGVQTYGKSTEQVVEQLKQAIKGVSNDVAKSFLSQIGLSHPDWIRYLRGELGGVSGSGTLAGMLSPTAGERYSTSLLGVSWNNFKGALSDLIDRLTATVAPLLSAILDVASGVLDALNLLFESVSHIFEAIAFDVGVLVGSVASAVDALFGIWDWLRDHFGGGQAPGNNIFPTMNPSVLPGGIVPKDISASLMPHERLGNTVYLSANVSVDSPEKAARYTADLATDVAESGYGMLYSTANMVGIATG